MEKKSKKKGGNGGNGLGYVLGGLALAGVGAGLYYLFGRNKNETKGKEENKRNNSNLQDSNVNIRNPQSNFRAPDPDDEFYTYEEDEYEQIKAFICPITSEIMRDPVITPYGITYEREAIEAWLDKNKSDPMTKKPLKKDQLIPNYALKNSIQDYIKKKKTKK